MNQGKEKSTNLKIDFREQKSGIIEELDKYANLLNYKLEVLPTGDYEIVDKIIVERKTLNDFLGSIKNGRIFQQAYRMAQSGKNGLIILEGDKSEVDSSSMSRKAVQGALLHLTVFIGVPVIRSSCILETATLLVDLFHQSQMKELPRQKSIISRSPGIRINQKQRQKLFFLRNLPGIGTTKAMALLKSFGSIEKVFNTSPAELTKVKGIGKKLANRIFLIVHEPF